MRSKGLVFLLISFFFVKTTQSQSNELIIKGQTGKLYLEHTVVAKENWYSIGRLYNISPKEIAPFNNLTLDKSLSIGEQLQIPLTAVNFSQDRQKAAAETLVPVYYIIQEKEWMYRISINHNKVPIPDLEKWNNIAGDQVRVGMHVIVGFLKVKTALSALASGAAGAPVAGVTSGAGASGIATSRSAALATSGATPPVVAAQTSAGVKQAPAAASVPAATSGQMASDNQGTATSNKPAVGGGASATSASTVSAPAASGTSAPATAAPVPAAASVDMNKPAAGNGGGAAANSAATGNGAVADAHAVINFNGGYFKADFSDAGKSVSGLAGTFKSTSGWKDGKYYALMNNVPVGTIVKITVPASSKSVYAKILGQLPDMKESAGLTIRISNAAAGELGGGDGKFTVEVKY